MRPFVLASSSPRRISLLNDLGYRPEIVPAGIDEHVLASENPEQCALRLAGEKVAAVHSRRPDAVVLAADTVVAIDGTILGKPADESAFARMMRLLSGRTHEVWTGVVVQAEGFHKSRATRTLVTFCPIDNDQIAWYWKSGEPRDKAGGYAMQGLGGAFVTGINGSPSNVVGLPMSETVSLLRAAGIPPPWKPE